ncbi:uncharacterized protein EI90DRAFT_3289996 [Cantharellus anzutake]|uniref:uncharacterized protein n=1 Tax=Cantharellus anzutake TaxID=1750568 RepID=UPI001905673C|nr:uncharacterized protein EI90DRAFT_3289996 [Cantharellus anzutake]KAF8329717.1 hypothetical protein EI90DRAFT_3289996 [Cantharellus anzutake]
MHVKIHSEEEGVQGMDDTGNLRQGETVTIRTSGDALDGQEVGSLRRPSCSIPHSQEPLDFLVQILGMHKTIAITMITSPTTMDEKSVILVYPQLGSDEGSGRAGEERAICVPTTRKNESTSTIVASKGERSDNDLAHEFEMLLRGGAGAQVRDSIVKMPVIKDQGHCLQKIMVSSESRQSPWFHGLTILSEGIFNGICATGSWSCGRNGPNGGWMRLPPRHRERHW